MPQINSERVATDRRDLALTPASRRSQHPGPAAGAPRWFERTLRASPIALLLTLVTLALVAYTSESPDAEPVNLPAERIVVGGSPWGVGQYDGKLWVSDASRAVLLTLDADTGQVLREASSGALDPRDAGLAAGGGRLWVSNLGGTVGVVDAATGVPAARIEVGPGEPAAVVLSHGRAWVPLHGPGGGLVRLDAARPHVGARRIDLPESGFSVAAAGATVWVAGLDGLLFAVDASSGTLSRTIDLGGAPRGIAVAGGDVWVTLRDARAVVRIDAKTGQEIARIPTEGQPWPIAVGGGFVWVAELEGRLLRIDLEANKVTATAVIGVEALGAAVGGGYVWVTSRSGVITRVALD